MYQVRMTVSGLPQALKAIATIEDSVGNKKDDYSYAALRGAATVFDKNFATEGGEVGGWADLAEQTVRERERKGFGGAHPILIRYGHLREVTATSLMDADGSRTFTKMDNDGNSINVSLKSRNGVLNVSAGGEKAVNQFAGDNRPARPYWFVNGHVQAEARKHVVEQLTKMIGGLF
jgi:hypothetical protein